MSKETKKVLVVIDMQKGFVNEYTKHLPQKIRDFIEANKDKFAHIVATKYINHVGTACYVFEGWKDCMEGSEGTQLTDPISEVIEKEFEKDKYSCWNNEFRQWLTLNKITDLYFCGVNTGCCILHSAFDAYNDLVSSYVIEDLCGSTSGTELHEAAIKVIESCITKERVVKSTEV